MLDLISPIKDFSDSFSQSNSTVYMNESRFEVLKKSIRFQDKVVECLGLNSIRICVSPLFMKGMGCDLYSDQGLLRKIDLLGEFVIPSLIFKGGSEMRAKNFYVPFDISGHPLYQKTPEGICIARAYTELEALESLLEGLPVEATVETYNGPLFLQMIQNTLMKGSVDYLALNEELLLTLSERGVLELQDEKPALREAFDQGLLKVFLVRELTYYLTGVHIPLGLPDDPIEVSVMKRMKKCKSDRSLWAWSQMVPEVRQHLQKGGTLLLSSVRKLPQEGAFFKLGVKNLGEFVRLTNSANTISFMSTDTSLLSLFEEGEQGFIYVVRGEDDTFYFDLKSKSS